MTPHLIVLTSSVARLWLLLILGFCLTLIVVEITEAWSPPHYRYYSSRPPVGRDDALSFSSRPKPVHVRRLKAASSSELRDERKRSATSRSNNKRTIKGEPNAEMTIAAAKSPIQQRKKKASSKTKRTTTTTATTTTTTKSSNKKTSNHPTTTYAANGAVSRIYRAAARASKLAKERQAQEAAAAAAAVAAATKSSSSSTTIITRDIQSPAQTTPPRIATLTELTKAIDQQLLLLWALPSAPAATTTTNRGSVSNRSARDSMTALVKYNLQQESLDQHRDIFLMRPKPTVLEVKHVAVLFGKVLLLSSLEKEEKEKDQIGIDYAGRIRRLVRAMKHEDYHPDVICFLLNKIPSKQRQQQQQQPTRDQSSSSGVNVASDVGYVFFRHLCAAQGVSLQNIAFYFQYPERGMEDDNDGDDFSAVNYDEDEKEDHIAWKHGGEEYSALQCMIQYLQTECLPRWRTDLVRNQQRQQDKPRPEKLRIHFSLFSSDYHLCQMHDTHLKSPNQSPFRALQLRNRDTSWSTSVRGSLPTATSSNSSSSNNPIPLETRWTYVYATTVPVFATDPARAFFFKVFRTAQQLRPVLLNLAAVVENREFFQQENYLVLVSARRSLVADMESIYQAQPSLKAVHRIRAGKNAAATTGGGGGVPADVVLESALLSLGRCLDLVRPAGLLTGTVSREDYMLASRVLKQAVDQISITCDPDEVLKPEEWGKLGDESDNVTKTPEQNVDDDEAALLLHSSEQELSCEVHLDDEEDEEDV